MKPLDIYLTQFKMWLQSRWLTVTSVRLGKIQLSTLWQQPLFPFFVVWFPVLSLYTHNITELESNILWFPLGALTILVCLLLIGFRLVFDNWFKASLALGLFLLINFSYGMLSGLLPENGFDVGVLPLTANRVLLPTLFLIITAIWYWLWRSTKNFSALIPVLNGASGVILILVMSQAVWVGISRTILGQTEVSNSSVVSAANSTSTLGYNPDVYYIIFDRYAGDKTLKDDYNYDNSTFLDGLKSQGFYVADQSAANYPYTPLSLSSTLNMKYHQSAEEDAFPYPDLATSIFPLLQDSKVEDIFHSLGYKVYQMGSWFPPTHTSQAADDNYVYTQLYNGLDDFSNLLLSDSMITPILEHVWPGMFTIDNEEDHLDNFYYQQRMFPVVANLSGPKFVFVHLLMPHSPYLVDSTCQPLSDGVADHQDEMTKYLAQLECANLQANSMVQTILSASSQKPIIILQSDEGPYSIKYHIKDSIEFKNASDDTILERSRILNAYYFPDANTDGLYQTITPVNSFRLLFTKYFGMDYASLDDKTYVFPSRPKLFSFMDVTDILTEDWNE